jgi:Thiol-disulfide isomerase and thioredoxins
MKKIYIALSILLLFFPNILLPQVNNDAINYFNKLYNLWDSKQYDAAIECSVKLIKLSPQMFGERIHNDLAQCILDGKLHGNSSEFLKLLFHVKNPDINKIIEPLHVLNSIVESNNNDSVLYLARTLMGLLADTSSYSSRAERYALLAIKQLETKNIHDNELKKQMLDKIVYNLKTNCCVDSTKVSGKAAIENRAWGRYVLSYSCNLLYKLNFAHKDSEENLKQAVKYSPDIIDKTVAEAYFYDAALLTGDAKNIGYEKFYLNYLINKNRIDDAVGISTRITFSEPADTNFNMLQTLYEKSNFKKTFAEYWNESIERLSATVPCCSIKFIDGKTVDFGKPTGKWIYIDVWATWCSGCRTELPDLEKIYRKNLTNSKSNLSIYSFSFRSIKLSEFMSEYKYTFPVAEVNKSVVDSFNVFQYPTKILITPEGRYLQIPGGEKWQEYLKNYCMMKSL